MDAHIVGAHAHRGGLATRVRRIWPTPGLFQRVGGREAVHRIVDALYNAIEADPELTSIFRHNIGRNRRRQKMFFEEWMGGEPLYSRHVSTQGTRLFHYIFPITPRAAGRWLRHYTAALHSEGLPPEVAREILQVLGPMARSLVRPPERGLPRRLRDAGDRLVSVLEECLEEDPMLMQHHPADFERILFLEAADGRLEGVRALVELGVDCNIPTWQEGVFVSPWCIAKRRGHHDVAEHLLECGARIDIFSLAYLGDREGIEAMLVDRPEWIDAGDPASDHQAVRPIYHAILGGHYDLARWFLENGATVGPQAVQWIRSLVEVEQIDLAREIVLRSSGPLPIGPGRWVLYPSLVEPLVERGADVNQPVGTWLRHCTHQVGQQEDADLVAALLEQGADLTARLDGCTALHLAVRAGYAKTVEVLLQLGAEVDAEDDQGNTPLGYLVFANRRADRPALGRRLLAAGADPSHADHQGRTPLARASKAKTRGAAELVAVLQAGEEGF